MPWACKHERHAYELCQYKQYTARLKKPEGGSQQHAATAAPAHH